LLVRRGLRALKDLNITYSLGDTVSFMIDQIREDYPEFFFNKGDILKLLKVEESRYKETLEKGRATVGKIATELTAAGKGFDVVVLDQTFFYPEGCGQEADHGTIDAFEVYDVQRTGPSVLHFVRGDASRLQGKRVACTIDANRREALMRNHTATHIVLGAARKVLGNHIWQAGAHKAADMARLDITHFDALTDAEFAKIEELANDQVLASRQVRAKFLARDLAERKFGFRLYQGGSVPGGELRVVEIPKWDVEACGGTHVARTSDVALIKLLRSTRIQDGVVRLEYAAGKGAFDAHRRDGRPRSCGPRHRPRCASSSPADPMSPSTSPRSCNRSRRNSAAREGESRTSPRRASRTSTRPAPPPSDSNGPSARNLGSRADDMDLGAWRRRIREYDEITNVGPIIRRYFVIGAFDGALTVLGIIIGAYAVGASETHK